MKDYRLLSTGMLMALLVTLPGTGALIQAAPKTTAATSEPQIPQSVFTIPASSREGRNPFFPRSAQEQQTQRPRENVFDSSSIALNGITSPPRRMAMINGRTFEEGESGEVKLRSGARVLIRCLEIRKDAAVISIGAERRELRLRTGI